MKVGLILCECFITYPNSVSVLISLFLSYELLMILRCMYTTLVWEYKDRFPTLRQLLPKKDDLENSIHTRQNPKRLHNLPNHYHIYNVLRTYFFYCLKTCKPKTPSNSNLALFIQKNNKCRSE